MTAWIACIVAAYLIGSIPFGYLIGRAKGIDIRLHGSRNVGATNVGRVLGRRLGTLCFVLDVLKGAVPVLAAGALNGVLNRPACSPRGGQLEQGEMWLWLAVAIAAVLGHMFPLFLRFRGGKGVATGFGGMAAMWPVLTIPALGALVVWYATLRLFKYVSLASMLAALSVPINFLLTLIPNDLQNSAAAVTHAWPPLVVTAVLALLVIYRHRGNIARLRRGEEPKISGLARRGGLVAPRDQPDP